MMMMMMMMMMHISINARAHSFPIRSHPVEQTASCYCPSSKLETILKSINKY